MLPESYLMAENQRKYCELMGKKFHEGFKYGVNSVTSEAKKFTEQMETYAEIMNNGHLSGDISSGYTYEVKTNNPYPNSIQKAFCDYIKHDIESTININQIIKKGENTMPVSYNEFFAFTHPRSNVYLPKIKDVIFNPPATIVLWDDKSKTVVKAQNGEPYDPEKGLAMCIVKKVYGNKGRYFNNISKWTDKYWEKEAEKVMNKTREETINKFNELGTCSASLSVEELKKAIELDNHILNRSDYFYARFLTFDTREEALDILDKMKEVRDTYGYVSVADLADLVGVNSAFLDSKLGWRVLRGSQINRVGNSYKLRLPEINWVAEGYEIKE